MKTTIERVQVKIGDVMVDEYGGRKKCAKAPPRTSGVDICRNCALRYDDNCIRYECRADHRDDGQEVYFVKEGNDGPRSEAEGA